MNFAEKNFADIIAEGKAAVLITHITKIVDVDSLDDEIQTGILNVKLLEELTQEIWEGPSIFVVRFYQYRDQLQKINYAVGWNKVEIKENELLLLALSETPTKTSQQNDTYSPICADAVEVIDSSHNELVESIKKCLIIEGTEDLPKRTAIIKEGLVSTMPFLSEYCHYAIGRLNRIPRQKAVEIEGALLLDKSQTMETWEAAQLNLELELWKEDDPEDPSNKIIIQTFFNAFETIKDIEFHKTLLHSLYSLLVDDVPGEKGQTATLYRQQLLKDIKLPNKQILIEVVEKFKKEKDLKDEISWLNNFINNL